MCIGRRRTAYADSPTRPFRPDRRQRRRNRYQATGETRRTTNATKTGSAGRHSACGRTIRRSPPTRSRRPSVLIRRGGRRARQHRQPSRSSGGEQLASSRRGDPSRTRSRALVAWLRAQPSQWCHMSALPPSQPCRWCRAVAGLGRTSQWSGVLGARLKPRAESLRRGVLVTPR